MVIDESAEERVKKLEEVLEVFVIYAEMTRKHTADNPYLCNKIHRDIQRAKLLLKQSQ